MKKFLTFFCAALCCGWLLSGCSEDSGTDTPSLETISLNKHALSLEVGGQETLTVSVVPETIEGLVFEWSSSNTGVATVDGSGVVKAVAVGEAVVKVSCEGKSDECTVTVSTAIESVTVTPSSAELLVGETTTLTAEVLPADADVTVTWTSTNPDVAKVDANGVVTGVAAGNAVIMAQAGGKSDDCMISVVTVPVESITLDAESIEIDEGTARTLRATILPEAASTATIYWSSSDEAVASVSGAGTVTGKRAGTATITARAGNCEATCEVTVNAVPLAVGHFYYSDGTWSSALDEGKTVIGVVCYLGDITAIDPALASDHPDCTHGLVVSLQESEGINWQTNMLAYNSIVSSWIEENTSYIPTYTDVGLEDNLNKPLGYNCTKAIEAFNEANSDYTVDVVEFVQSYRETVPAPAASSDWYLPSVKELSLMITGEYSGNIWEIGTSGSNEIDNLKVVNESMKLVPDAVGLGQGMQGIPIFYWSSMEMDVKQAFVVGAYNGGPTYLAKAPEGEGEIAQFNFRVRPVLAF